MQGIGAIVIFLLVLQVWRSIYVRRGNIRFWQLAASQPDAAFEWMQGRADWFVLLPEAPEVDEFMHSTGLVAPFKLGVPSVGGTVVIFARSESIDESQEEFIELYGSRKERRGFPWLSSLAMIYPVAGMLTIAVQGAPFLPTLGYGFANLGYLLFAAGLLSGSFQALGFRYRKPTLVAAVAVWVVGLVLDSLSMP